MLVLNVIEVPVLLRLDSLFSSLFRLRLASKHMVIGFTRSNSMYKNVKRSAKLVLRFARVSANIGIPMKA